MEACIHEVGVPGPRLQPGPRPCLVPSKPMRPLCPFPCATHQTAVLAYDGDRSESGLFHGTGTATFTSGQEYAGTWQLGHMHGSGRLTFPDGASWEGSMQQSAIDGTGVGDLCLLGGPCMAWLCLCRTADHSAHNRGRRRPALPPIHPSLAAQTPVGSHTRMRRPSLGHFLARRCTTGGLPRTRAACRAGAGTAGAA